MLLLFPDLSGDQTANEERVHPGVLQRQEVNVRLLLTCQVSQSFCREQDVCQGERCFIDCKYIKSQFIGSFLVLLIPKKTTLSFSFLD